MDVNFACTGCGQNLAVDESGVGQTVECPACKQPLIVPRKVTSPIVKLVPPVAPPVINPKPIPPSIIAKSESHITNGVKFGFGLFVVAPLILLFGLIWIILVVNPEFWRGVKDGFKDEIIIAGFLWDNLFGGLVVLILVAAAIWSITALVRKKAKLLAVAILAISLFILFVLAFSFLAS